MSLAANNNHEANPHNAPVFIDSIDYNDSPYHLFYIDGRFTVCYASGAICANDETFARVVYAYTESHEANTAVPALALA